MTIKCSSRNWIFATGIPAVLLGLGLQLAAGCCTGAGGPWGREVLSSQPQPAHTGRELRFSRNLETTLPTLYADALYYAQMHPPHWSRIPARILPNLDGTRVSYSYYVCTGGPYVTLFLGLGIKSYISPIYSCEVDIAA